MNQIHTTWNCRLRIYEKCLFPDVRDNFENSILSMWRCQLTKKQVLFRKSILGCLLFKKLRFSKCFFGQFCTFYDFVLNLTLIFHTFNFYINQFNLSVIPILFNLFCFRIRCFKVTKLSFSIFSLAAWLYLFDMLLWFFFRSKHQRPALSPFGHLPDTKFLRLFTPTGHIR